MNYRSSTAPTFKRWPYFRPPDITSIADVDAFITDKSDNLPHDVITKINKFEVHFWEKSLTHRRLLLLRRIFRSHPAVDKRFRERRDISLQTIQTDPHSPVHIRLLANAFSEINRANSGCFGGGRVHRFLDLGCAPGGFSSWLMSSNRDVQGVGITLPHDTGETLVQIDPSLLAMAQYRVRHENLISIAMDSVTLGTLPVIQSDDRPFEPYDLVIAGAFPTLQGHIPWWLRVQMMLSQVLIVMSNTAQAGSSIILINTKPFLWAVDVMGLLRQSFDSVAAHKGGKLHAVRTSCYLVCRGFHASAEEIDRASGKLRGALQHLATVAAESYQDEEGMRVDAGHPEDLPLVSGESAEEIFDMNHHFVLGIFEPMWESQYEAIRSDFANVLAGEIGERDNLKPRQSSQSDSHLTESNSALSRQDGGLRTDSSPPQQTAAQAWRPRQPRFGASDGFVGFKQRRRTRKRVQSTSVGQPTTDDSKNSGRIFGRRPSNSAADTSTWWRSK